MPRSAKPEKVAKAETKAKVVPPGQAKKTAPTGQSRPEQAAPGLAKKEALAPIAVPTAEPDLKLRGKLR